MVTKVLFFRPTLDDGGADRVTVTLLRHLDRVRFEPALALAARRGVLLSEVPADVPIFDLDARRLAFAAPALARVIRRTAPDVIFSTSSGSNTVAVAARMLARSRARLVLSERTTLTRKDVSRLRQLVELPLKRLAYRRADLVTAVSAGVAQELVERLGLPGQRVSTVWNPVVTDDIASRASERLDHPFFGNQAPVLVACGRLIDDKDYPTLLDAFGRISAVHPARLVILGDGPLRSMLEARARSLGLATVVSFVGFDPNPFKYMSRAYLVLQASRREGLPGTLIQSMAVGTPVVATDCEHGVREVVTDGEDGWVVPVGDARALAQRALELLADRPRRDGFGVRARQTAARFSMRASLMRYEDAILGEAR